MLQLLGSQQFGVWLVLISVFQWITLFDLGVSAGARNEIARAAASKDAERVQRAVSTGWFYVALIALALFTLVALVLSFTSAAYRLQTHAFGGVDASSTLWLVTAGACASFVAGYVQSIFAALENAAAFSIFSLLSNLGFLALLGMAQALSLHRMAEIAILYVLAILGANACLILNFFKSHPQYRPRLNAVDHTMRGRILGFGVRMFVIQLAALVIFTTSRLLASILLGPESVVVYDAGFKVFSLVTMVHTLIMATLWSSFTQAHERGETAWIRRTLVRLLLLMVPLTVACTALALLSPWLISLWLGPSQVGTPLFYALFAASTILVCWNNIFAYFLNGIGDTKVQLLSAIAAGVLNVPATYFCTVTVGLGISGVPLGTLLSLSLFAFLGPMQVLHLLRAKKR
jgi:O-antigen/teichoic acid export membrane protein